MSGIKSGMKAGEIIPVKKEFSFLFKMASVMVVSAVAAMAVLYLLLDKDVEDSYGAAFQMLSRTHDKMNFYITAAVIVQLIFSSIVIYFVALYFSHKIAGPVFRLKAVLQQYMEGEEVDHVSFRTSDFIPGVSTLFTDFFSRLGKRKQLLEVADSLVKQLESGKDKEKRLQQLKTIIQQLEK